MEQAWKTMESKRNIAVIVAHPDDETLWCGGEMLMHPENEWTVISLCRKTDPDRAPKFQKALAAFHANGIMGDLDDGPAQIPIPTEEVEESILKLLPQRKYDRIITHSPFGEYTRHRRHEEVGKAVINLWNDKKIAAHELWFFAYEDGNKSYHPRAILDAHYSSILPDQIWKEKYRIITEIYGFEKSGFEASTTPEIESFWKFDHPDEAMEWLDFRKI